VAAVLNHIKRITSAYHQRLRQYVPPALKLPKLLVLDLNGFLVHRVYLGAEVGDFPAWTAGSHSSRILLGGLEWYCWR
jgi:hypothetical protein